MTLAPQRASVVRAVAFDLDGTLAVTEQDRETLLETAAERADVRLGFDREDYLAAHRAHSGTKSREPIFETLVGGEAAALTAAYREAVGEALLAVEDAADVVAALREEYRVGLLTDGPERTQRDKLRRLGWTDTFDAVVVTGTIGAPKPEGAAFSTLTERLGTAPAETVYVGDDPHRDIEGAAEAGFRPVQVLYNGGPEPHRAAALSLQRDEIRSLPRRLEKRLGDGPDDP